MRTPNNLKMDKNCPVCFGVGWVCENHPYCPWDQALGCECGAGLPCQCNKRGEPDTSGLVPEAPIIWH